MDNGENDMAIEEVIFLGAGASASDGAPLQNDLLRDYFDKNWRKDGLGALALNKNLSEFFKDFYGLDTINNSQQIKFPSFEEVLGILELSISRAESFRNYPLTTQNPTAVQTVRDIREQIILLIAKILKEKLQISGDNHNVLVSRLESESRLDKTAFISLNYDILIDNALIKKHSTIDLDYGVEFTNFESINEFDRPRNVWRRPRKNRSIKLCKLHGSLNWLYCPACVSLTITPKEKSVSSIADVPRDCKYCLTEMIPIIIPPTFFKVMSNHFLQQIWREAEDILMTANRIVFCGYSFPDADIHIKYLLKRVEVNRTATPNIYVFNNHAGKADSVKEQEKDRYERFFSDKERVRYLDKSFEDFCRNGINP